MRGIKVLALTLERQPALSLPVDARWGAAQCGWLAVTQGTLALVPVLLSCGAAVLLAVSARARAASRSKRWQGAVEALASLC